MAKLKNGVESLITRDQYKALKKMDRPEVEIFLSSVYQGGYQNGYDVAKTYYEARVEQSTVERERADDTTFSFMDRLRFFLESVHIPGIGQETRRKIEEAAANWSDGNGSKPRE